MKRNAQELYVRPLFFDALSGEFTPPTDSLPRTHTLGRLAYATFVKGAEDKEFSDGQGLVGVRYEPAWAPNVSVLADCVVGNESFTLSGLSIKTKKPQGNSLMIYDGIMNGEDEVLGLGTQEDDLILPLELGENLAQTRERVTQTAQAFFNKPQ